MASAVQNWGSILSSQNLPEGEPMDAVSRWLLITRASVIPMTLFSALIGGLLAAPDPAANWLYWWEPIKCGGVLEIDANWHQWYCLGIPPLGPSNLLDLRTIRDDISNDFRICFVK